MTRQIRTWHERDATDGEPRRWDVAINDVPVPGGYVAETADGRFAIHYPRLESKVVDTLDEAKRRIELAPPVTKGAMAIANPLDDDAEEDLISTDEAGELLGVSRFRVNAMVANGVLAGKQADGKTLVSRVSVEARKSRPETSGPVGRFAHTFICYYPDGGAEACRIVEIDPAMPEQIDGAKAFLQAVIDGEGAAQVDVLDYRQAMALCAKARRSGGAAAAAAQPISFREFEAVKGRWLAEAFPKAPSAESSAV
jgi:hypothetical protein